VSTSVAPPGWSTAEVDLPAVKEPPTRPRSLRRPLSRLQSGAVAAILLVGAVLVVFGSSSGGPTGPVAQAATLTSTAPGYRMHVTIAMTSSAAPAPMTATIDAVVDGRDHASSMSMDLSGISSQGLSPFSSGPARMQMIIIGSTVFVKLPATMTTAFPNTAQPWIKLDLNRVASLPGMSTVINDPTASDPANVLRLLRQVSGNVTNLGPALVGGINTTHFHADLTLAELANSMPGASGAFTARVLPMMQRLLQAGSIPIDVWIDAHHLVRRLVMALNIGFPGGRSLQESATADFTNYGPQPLPVIPAANQVQDLSQSIPLP
jgi:hypothetical protein